MPDSDLDSMKQEIVKYLLDRPDASDDLEGIARFWITSRRVEVAVAAVKRAIDALVEDGLVKRQVRRTRSGRVLATTFELNKDQLPGTEAQRTGE